MASQRRRLGLSAAECGLLIGASAQSIYNWEEGKARPRAQHLAAIFALRNLGRRQANEILETRKAARDSASSRGPSPLSTPSSDVASPPKLKCRIPGTRPSSVQTYPPAAWRTATQTPTGVSRVRRSWRAALGAVADRRPRTAISCVNRESARLFCPTLPVDEAALLPSSFAKARLGCADRRAALESAVPPSTHGRAACSRRWRRRR